MPWDCSNAKEYRLLTLLETQFPWMAKSYADSINAISAATEAGRVANNPSLHWCSDGQGRKFFRLDLDLPALFMLSEPVSRFKAYRQYVIPIDAERQYYANLALIPAYFGNFNRMTCIDLYGDEAAAFFAADSRPLQGSQEVFWRFEPSSPSPSQLSSLNFVLKWSAHERELTESVRAAMSLYFQHAFWVLPRRGFACNAHIIHSRDNISRIMKVAKSLYIVRSIGQVHPERIAPYHTSLVQKVKVDVVTNSGDVRQISTYLAKDVVERLTSQSPGENNTMINGVIYEFKDKVARPDHGLSMLSVVEDFLPTDYDLFRTLSGLSAYEIFRADQGTFGGIGTVEDLRKRISLKYRRYAPEVEIAGTLLSRTERPVEYLIDSLYPVLIQEEGEVFFVHPIFLSVLLKLGLDRRLDDHDSTMLVNLIRLVQKMQTEKPIRLRFSEEAGYFKGLGIDFSQLLPAAYSAFCGIQVSRLLDDYL
jgi:hypothetical protein